MENYSNALARIKSLECPTGGLEERMQEILSLYNVADENSIKITRDKRYDREGAQGYRIVFTNQEEPAKIILAKSGAEDYVVKVIDVIDAQ